MRARAPEAKAARRRALLDGARGLLDQGAPLAGIPIASVAEAAGLAKGTAYLYFPSKEALFLELLLEDLEAWFETVDAALAARPELDQVGPALTTTLVGRPRLLRLLAELHTTLEAGIDVPTARSFKERLGEGLIAADARARLHLPGLAPGAFARLLVRTHALVVGIGPMSRPPPAVQAALAEPALAWMRVDLEAELASAITDWIRGGALGG